MVQQARSGLVTRLAQSCNGHVDVWQAIEPISSNFAGVKYTGMYTYPGLMDALRVLNYKEQHRWFRELSMDDFLALGLLTADELPILQVN